MLGMERGHQGGRGACARAAHPSAGAVRRRGRTDAERSGCPQEPDCSRNSSTEGRVRLASAISLWWKKVRAAAGRWASSSARDQEVCLPRQQTDTTARALSRSRLPHEAVRIALRKEARIRREGWLRGLEVDPHIVDVREEQRGKHMLTEPGGAMSFEGAVARWPDVASGRASGWDRRPLARPSCREGSPVGVRARGRATQERPSVESDRTPEATALGHRRPRGRRHRPQLSETTLVHLEGIADRALATVAGEVLRGHVRDWTIVPPSSMNAMVRGMKVILHPKADLFLGVDEEHPLVLPKLGGNMRPRACSAGVIASSVWTLLTSESR